MRREIVSVEPTATVAEAVALMNQTNVGAVVILSPIKDPLGIFTERDLLRRVVGKQLNPKTTKIQSVMTPGLVCAQASDDALELLQSMSDNNFRHLPVLDGKELAGIISLKDFYKFFLEKRRSLGV